MSQPTPQLAALGWDDYFDEKFKQITDDSAVPARVIADYGAEYLVHDGNETRRATAKRVDPGVGDWVALHETAITAIVERRTGQWRRRRSARRW